MNRYTHHRLPIRSELLRDNPLGDPHERTLHVLAPSDPALRTAKLPVVWVLVGYSSTAEGLFVRDPWSENLHERVERLTAEGALPPAIFVVPDCFTALGGSQYLNSTATGRYEDHLWQELKPAVDERFGTAKHGITGKSSGGFGALVQAMRHPELLSAVAAHSADICFEYCYLADLPHLANALQRHGGIEGLLAAFRADPKKRDFRWIQPLNVLCMAACYSPDPLAPGGIALPFEPSTAALRPEIWQRWLEHDPLRLVDLEPMAQALRGLDLLFLDCGVRDEYQLHWGLRQFVAKLKSLGIAHEHQEFDDGHRSTSYRYDVSLPKLVHALGAL